MVAALTIAVDAMGADKGPEVVLRGANKTAKRHAAVRFLIFGRESEIAPHLESLSHLRNVCDIVDCTDVIGHDAKPSQVIRQGKNSSMWKAIESVRDGKAQAVVSAGNTGVLMAMAKLILKTLAGIDRPALIAFLPTVKGARTVLDLGANIDCGPRHLFQFAIMGDAFMRSVAKMSRVRVGLLNVGAEDEKGHDTLKETAELLRGANIPSIEFHGFVEGTDIGQGTVDVVVTDGFTGNIALKTVEGTATMFASFLRQSFQVSFFARMAGWLAQPALQHLKRRLDPREYNGAVFIGLNGIVVKSHGGTDAYGFANALHTSIELARHELNSKILDELKSVEAYMNPPKEPAAAGGAS